VWLALNQFNLLPVDLRDKRRRRKLGAALLTVQLIILTLALASFPLIRLAASYITARSGQLTVSIASQKYSEAGHIADELSRLRAVASAAAYLNDLLSPGQAKSEWLAMVNNTIPDGVTLKSFEISDGSLSVSCQAEELSFIEEHRLNLTEEGFTPILGRVSSLNGMYSYTLIANA
jgi:hypothetical protein